MSSTGISIFTMKSKVKEGLIIVLAISRIQKDIKEVNGHVHFDTPPMYVLLC